MVKQAFVSLNDGMDTAACEALIRGLSEKLADYAEKTDAETIRIYGQEVEGKICLFLFLASGKAAAAQELNLLSDITWRPAHHVYEFKLHEGDDYTDLQTAGIIIGVENGKLDHYIQLHDEQPQVIHDLCYQNGFRRSSIFAVTIPGAERMYLLQFQDFFGEENPELYQDETYLEWLRVTGECQKPLPGEKFWKSMQELWLYRR